MESGKQETWLALRAQAGDREAFDRLFRMLQEPLYRYIFSLVGARAPAEDVLQEVFILIYRKIRWLREPELLRPWVYRIATREAFKHLKRERRWTDKAEDESVLLDLPAPSRDEMAPEIGAQLIAQLVERLSPATIKAGLGSTAAGAAEDSWITNRRKIWQKLTISTACAARRSTASKRANALSS
jgi:RNA polymerase sigma factor (sigma-70 family)